MQAKVQIQKQKAITLIALVITVIVLLILAGVTISALGGNDGLIAKVEKAKIEQMKAEAKENINMAIIQIQTQEVPKGTEVTLETLNDNLNVVDNRVQPKDYAEGNTELKGIYAADKNTKFSFKIDEKLNVIIGEIAEEEKTFTITVTDIEKTSLRVTGDADELNAIGATKFTYIALTSTSSEIKYENITATSYTVTGLEPGTEYDVYMLAYDNAGNETKSNVETVTTKSIPDGTAEGAIKFGATTWTDGKAGVTISTSETSFYIEYQVNGTDGTWTKGTSLGTNVTVSGLSNRDTVYARLTDGTYSGKYATLTIADTKGPEEFTIKVSNASETSIKISGSTTDTDSGIKDYSYYVKTSDGTVVNKKEHTTATSYEATGLTKGTEYTVYMVAYDNAGNETKSNERTITVQKPLNYAASGVVQYDAGTWTQAEINELTSKKLYDYNSAHKANSKFKLNSSSGLNFTFGGFKAGDSRNASVSSASAYGTPRYDGWQILESNFKDGKTYVTKLVHAGSPENFVCYYTTPYDIYRAEYLLSSGTRQLGYKTLKTGETINPREWDMYKDKSQLNLIENVHIMTKSEAINITGDTLSTNTLRNTGAYYITSSARTTGVVPYSGIYWVKKDGAIEDNATNQGAIGFRPIVSLKSGVYIVSGTGIEADPYVLGIDN